MKHTFVTSAASASRTVVRQCNRTARLSQKSRWACVQCAFILWLHSATARSKTPWTIASLLVSWIFWRAKKNALWESGDTEDSGDKTAQVNSKKMRTCHVPVVYGGSSDPGSYA